MAEYQPFPIPEALALIGDGLPQTVAEQCTQVFVGASTEPIANAEAIATTESTRFVVIYAGLTYATLAYSALYERFLPLFVKEWKQRSPGGKATHEEAWSMAVEVGKDIRESFLRDEIVGLCRRWMRGWEANSISLPNREELAGLPPPDVALPMTALSFAIAHELAHHVLGHTDPTGVHEDSVYPARQILREQKELRDLHNPGGMNPAQSAELEADLFAFFCLTGAFVRSDTKLGLEIATWYIGTSGGFVALNSLDLAARHGAEAWTSRSNWSHDGPTHPSLDMRTDQVVDAVASCRYEDGSANDTDGNPMPHPISVAIQLAAARQVMGQ